MAGGPDPSWRYLVDVDVSPTVAVHAVTAPRHLVGIPVEDPVHGARIVCHQLTIEGCARRLHASPLPGYVPCSGVVDLTVVKMLIETCQLDSCCGGCIVKGLRAHSRRGSEPS